VPTATLVVCDHGLGHLRRMALIAIQLLNLDFDVILLAPYHSYSRICSVLPALGNIRCIDFSTNTIPDLLSSEAFTIPEWLLRAQRYLDSEIVICDNLPEILLIRPDSILISNFFWHDVLPAVSTTYLKICSDLLLSLSPIVIGCSLFAMPAVRICENFQPVGLFAPSPPQQIVLPKSSPPSILLTGGSTKTIRHRMQLILDRLISEFKPFSVVIYVDSNLYHPNMPSHVLPASFKPAMFRSLSVAFCRPGLGILTDLLQYQIPVYCLSYEANAEIKYNAEVVESLGLGKVITEDFSSITSLRLQQLIFRPNIYPSPYPCFDGATQATTLIQALYS